MQSAASKRVLSTLASTLHPQLPLSPRESQQLLTLLTTSFRAHLDREHPTPENRRVQQPAGTNGQRSPSPTNFTTSYASTSRHIDSILTNPLFVVKPRRRASEPAAVDVMRNPMRWFIEEIATGTATLPKAAMCLDILNMTPELPSQVQGGKTPALTIAEWLRTSGLDNSREFVELHTSKSRRGRKLLDRLVPLLLAQGDATPWRWFIRSQDLRIKETNLDAKTVASFRQQVLFRIVSTQATKGLGEAMAAFMQAFRMAEVQGHESAYNILRPAGAHLVDCINLTSNPLVNPELYQSFLLSTRRWLGKWSEAVESMLWVHHPTARSATQGLQYIKDPAGAVLHVNGTQSRRHFLVKLCLAVARQLLQEDKYVDAQVAMEFTKIHFGDFVLSQTVVHGQQATTQRKQRKERENLELLDRLIPT
jgi:hypothetical protein